MTDVPEQTKEAVGPHVCEEESIRAARSVQDANDDHRVWSTIVTDRRVLDVKSHRRESEVDIDVSSYSLADDRIYAVDYDENASTSLSILKVLAVLAGLLGLVFFAVGAADDGGGGEIILLGVLMLIGAALAWYFASDPLSGEVRVEVSSTAASKEWEFPRGEHEVPRAISRVAMEHQT